MVRRGAQWAVWSEVQRDPTLAGWPVAQTEEGWEASMGGALVARRGAQWAARSEVQRARTVAG